MSVVFFRRYSDDPADASIDYPLPVLKWAGGKRAQVDTICARMEEMLSGEKIATYHEPFVGAGAVFFHLSAQKRFHRAILSDTNAELIGMYQALRDDPVTVIAELKKLTARPPSAVRYYTLRASRPRTLPKRAARMIYLNKTGYNGLYRVNRRGEFNVPYGKPKPSVQIFSEDNLLAVSRALQGVELAVRSFESSLLLATQPQDFVYLDPPYVPVSKTSNFAAYQKAGFDSSAQKQLAEMFRRYAVHGGLGLLSNSYCPETLRLYQGFVRHRIAARRSINSKGSARGLVSELLVETRFRK